MDTHAPDPKRLGGANPTVYPRNAEGLVDLRSMGLDALTSWIVDELGETPGRALLVYKALWQEGVQSFDEMTSVHRPLRELLARVASIETLTPERVLPAADGTTKFLWALADGSAIESVLIPDGDRVTLCMSSQVGCAMGCTFCVTADLGLKRHLTAGEIASQALQVGQTLPPGERITNLVLMGMGEPLHNLDNLVVALDNCLHDHGLNYSHRRVTVSTVGLVPRMGELAARLPVNLAVSLNASTDAQRRQIMPITRKHDLAELMQACRDFPLPNGKRITFEYVMLAGFNDSLEDAERVRLLVEGIPAKINLIPYNENPDRDLKRPSPEQVKAFQHHLVSQGVSCSVRVTRGIDIAAACGQLGKTRGS